MHTRLAAFLVGIPLITACSDGGSTIRIHAPDQSVAVLEDGVWTDVAMNEGVGEHTPDGPFALAAICRLPAGDVRLGGVHVVLAAPGEVTETRSSCRPRPRTVAGTMEILGASAPVKVFAGGYELVQSTGSAGLPPGRQDIVAYDAFQHRLVLVRDVIIAEGFHVALDFTSPAPVAPRPRAHRLVLETRNGTTVTEYGTASDGIHAVSLSPSILVDEDRQWVIGLVSEPDPLGMHQAFVRLDVGRDAPAGGLPAWTGHTVSDARVQAEGGRMSAEWSSDGPWTTRRVRLGGSVSWFVEAHAGWDGGGTNELRVPDIATHPAWDDALRLRTGAEAWLELAERIDDWSEGFVETRVITQPSPL